MSLLGRLVEPGASNTEPNFVSALVTLTNIENIVCFTIFMFPKRTNKAPTHRAVRYVHQYHTFTIAPKLGILRWSRLARNLLPKIRLTTSLTAETKPSPTIPAQTSRCIAERESVRRVRTDIARNCRAKSLLLGIGNRAGQTKRLATKDATPKAKEQGGSPGILYQLQNCLIHVF